MAEAMKNVTETENLETVEDLENALKDSLKGVDRIKEKIAAKKTPRAEEVSDLKEQLQAIREGIKNIVSKEDIATLNKKLDSIINWISQNEEALIAKSSDVPQKVELGFKKFALLLIAEAVFAAIIILTILLH